MAPIGCRGPRRDLNLFLFFMGGRTHGATMAGGDGARPRDAFRMLVASELRRRARTYALLVAVFVLTSGALGVILGSVAGVMGSIGGEIRETLTSDHRIVRGDPTNLGGGRLFAASDAAIVRLSQASGATLAARVEVQGLFLHAGEYEDFDSGLLVGVDPVRDARVASVDDRVVAGRWLDAENLWLDGTPYPQLVVGEDMLRALNMSIYEEGAQLTGASLLNVTAGRFSAEEGALRPVVKTGVVVGAFRTGFNPIDRRTVYVHADVARELLRAQFDHEVANVLLATGGDADALAAAARAEGFNITSAADFRDHYLSAVVTPLRAFTALVTVMVLALAGGWVTHVVAGAVLADRRRIAVLRALGVPSRLIVGPIAATLIGCAALGILLGLGAALVLAAAVGVVDVRVPGLDRSLAVALDASTVTAIALGVLATAVLAASGAGVALRRIAPVEALRE